MSEVLAGKIGVTNGGEWNAETYYEEATFVRHQNNLYLSNLPSTGVEPTNEEYWMLAMEGFSGEDVQTLIDSINNIINGTTQVGNALTLDGHGAEYFATAVDMSKYLPNKAEVLSTSILETVKKLPDYSVKFYKINGSLYTGGDLPSGDYYKYSNALAFKYDEDTATVILFGFGISTRRIAVNHMVSNEWRGWQLYATDAELAKYIAKTDKPTGTYTGNGDATARRIAIGGIGDVVVLTSVNGSAIVTVGGTTVNSPSGGVSRLSIDEIKAINGYLNLATTNSIVNGNGVEVTYRVL